MNLGEAIKKKIGYKTYTYTKKIYHFFFEKLFKHLFTIFEKIYLIFIVSDIFEMVKIF